MPYKEMQMKLLFLLAAAFFAVPSGVSARMQTVPRKISIEKEAAIPLIRGGVPCVEIVLPKQASRVTEFASKELQNLLSESFGRKIEIVNSPGTDKTSIILGDNEFSRKAGITMAALPRDGFIIRSEGNTVYIAGRDNPLTNIEWARNQLSIWANYFERGTMNGVYDFLERFLGVRFYFPGELGTIVPKYTELSIPRMDILERPDYTVRLFTWYQGDWFDHSPEWGNQGVRAKTLNLYRTRHETEYLPCNHGLLALNYSGRFAKTHPEYFSIIDGKRSNLDRHPYLCFNSGIVEEIYQDAKAFLSGKSMADRNALNQYGKPDWDPSACQKGYFNIMPQDGFRMCECTLCKKIRSTRPFPGIPDKEISDHIWGMTAGIARRLKEEGISGCITQMAYWPYNRVPDFPLPDNVLVMVGVRGPWNPASGDALISGWSEKIGRKVWLWTYAGKFGARRLPGIPSSTPRAVGKYYPARADRIFGAYMESDTDRYLYHYLNYYVFGKVMWDNSTDVNALLEEHYRLMYGNASSAMKQIFERIEEDWLTKLQGKYIENEQGVFYQYPSEYEMWNKIYPPSKLKSMEEDYDKAEQLAETGLQKRRIRLMKQEFFGRLLQQGRDYHDKVRQSEEWGLAVPEQGSVSAYLHRIPDGGVAPGHVVISVSGKMLRFSPVGIPAEGLEILVGSRRFNFTGETLEMPLSELGKEKLPFDVIRTEKGQITERWNFFLDSKTLDAGAFGYLVAGSPDDGNIVINGELAGEGAPWYGPLYANDNAGVYLDKQIFLSGGQSMRLESKGNYSTSMWQNLPQLKPNTRYRITFYVKLENVVPHGAGGVISTCFDQVNRWYPAGPLTGTMPWTKQCNEIVTGPETNRKYPSYFNITLRNASGRAWVDHIRIYEIGTKETK